MDIIETVFSGLVLYAIAFGCIALAVIGVVVVILAKMRKVKKNEAKKVSQADKENDEYIDYLKRQRQVNTFLESFPWFDDPTIPSDDAWKTARCSVTQRDNRRKKFFTKYEEAYKMVQQYIDMCFEHFGGQNAGYWPFVVDSVESEERIEDIYRPSNCFKNHCEGYLHKKRVEYYNANKKEKDG